MASVADRAHCRRNLRGKERKGGRGGNCLKAWMLAVPRCSGGFSSGHFWIDGLRLRAATKAAQRRRPCRSRALLVDLLLSLHLARQHARRPRGGPNGRVSKLSNQRPVERLEAENAQLRDTVVDLMLQIQALRDGAR